MFTSKHVVLLKSSAGNLGGLEKYAARVASGFVEKGARVSILTTGSPKNAFVHPSISFYPVKTSPWPSFLRMEQFDGFVRKWLQAQKPDLVFGMDRNRMQTHIRAGNGVHIAYLKSRVFTEGRIKHWVCLLNPMHRKILELEKEAFENPQLQKLFANSHMVRGQLLEHYAIDPAKIEVIHNGVEWKEMEQDFLDWESKKMEACARFHLDPDRFHFLFIGSGYLRKGLDRLLEGLSRLNRADFHLSVIGKDNKMDHYYAKAVQLGLKDNVRFFGPQQETRIFYQLADVLVIPSFYDPFANVTVEALAMGLFVISSKNNGGCEIISEKNGAVIDNLLDTDSMVEALQKSMQHRKTVRSAELARQGVCHLDFSKQLNKLIEACG
jgi:UDP-glucose:(heptosyl)LPS alpha-1,3-glucosyltransferase